MKLRDSQLVVLNRANNHPDGLVDVSAVNAKAPIARHNLLAGLLKKRLVEEALARDDATVWRKGEEGRFALALTDAGKAALGVDEETAKATESRQASKARKALKPKPKPKPVAETAKAPREGTKQAQLIAMLKRAKGVTIAEVVETLGWQAHTARAAISHAIGKRLGLAVSSAPEKRGRVYRIAG